MAKMTREQAIDTLVCNDIFYDSDVGTVAMEFYIKNLMENTDYIYDIDRYAWLNTLFGYDIGFDNAMKIADWLWGSKDDNGKYRDIETLDIGYKDKPLIEQCVKELGLDLSFNKWTIKEPDVYRYEFD